MRGECVEDRGRLQQTMTDDGLETSLDYESSPVKPMVEFYWRPGCGFCARLGRALDAAGIEAVTHNIWEEPEAAARVRSVARGNETVPTVFVGGWSGVNPSLQDVVSAIGRATPASA